MKTIARMIGTMGLILALLAGLVGIPAYGQGATGGTITQEGSVWVHTFTSGGNFQITNSAGIQNVEMLVVGGGGAGGGNSSSSVGCGGGGGGDFVTNSYALLATQTIAVTIGAGAVGGNGVGQNGGTSTVAVVSPATNIVAIGGGGGGYRNAGGKDGASGGGGAWGQPGGTNIGVRGNRGGNQTGTSLFGGAGGGGAFTNGADVGNSDTGGNGGQGLAWHGVTYSSGGGGGSRVNAGTNGIGGANAGNGGYQDAPGSNAPANYGGGGGGASGNQTGGRNGGNGGSGVVIFRYEVVVSGSPQFALQPVSGLTTNSANLIATLSGTNADVYVYWDTQDKGTNFTWAYTNSPLTAFTNTPVGATITNTATGLASGTQYSYRFFGTNATSGLTAWSAAGSFITPGPPTVDNTNGASGIAVGAATLNGRVTATNSGVCYGKFFWGPTDGSNNPTAWAYTNDISGTVTQGVPYSVTLSNLLYGQQYYYRAAASNSYGFGWATNSVGFVTAMPLVPAVPTGYVIRYTFENAGTTTVTNDGSAGATYDGTLVSTATLPTITNGVGRGGGKALSMLTGTSRQAVQIGSSASSGWGPNGGIYTLSLWFYGMYDATGYRTAFKRDWNTDDAMYITDSADAQNMRVYSGGWKDATTQFSMKPYRQGQSQGSSWHMLTFVATNTVTQTYVDGVAAGSTIPWVFGVNIGTIGGNKANDNRNFAQYLDDVYIYDRALTSNEVVSLYQNPNTAVVTIGISNLTASSGTSTSAVLNATLQGTGSVFNVSAYYWVVGAASSNVAAVGTFTNVASTNLSVTVTNLTPGMSYAYTFLASNAATNLWATPAVGFGTVDVNMQTTDPTGRVTLADTAAFTVYRPAAATNGDLTVNFTLSGTATNGVNYTNSPAASGTNGTVTILAGQTNAVITVYPLNATAPEQTVVLTLASGGYVIGSVNSATCTLAAATAWVAGSNRYWVAAGPGNWNNTANWSFAPYGPGGWSVPASTNVAIFDGSGAGNCTMDTAVNVAGIVLTNGYAGTVTQAAPATVTVGASGWSQSAGTFSGGTNTIALNGSWSLSGGTFNAGNQILSWYGNTSVALTWTNSGGTFNAGSSMVWVYPDSAGLTIGGSQTVNNLTVNGAYNTHYPYLTIPTGTTLTVAGTLSLYDGASNNKGVIFLGTGTIVAQGNITASCMAANQAYAGTVRLLINGGGDQTFTNAGARLTRVEINKTGGTLSLAGTHVVGGDGSTPGYWTYTAGNLSAGTSMVQFFGDNGGLTISGSHTLNNVLFDSVYNTHSDTITLSAGTTLSVAGALTLGNTNVVGNTTQPTLNGGAINAAGDVGIALNNTCSGSSVLNFTGAGNQQVSYAGDTATRFRLSPVTVNKTGGALSLATDLSLGTTGQLVWTNGAVNLSSNTLTAPGAVTIYTNATTLGVTVADATKAGRLLCGNTVSNLGNVGLAMAISATAAQMSGQTYTILTNTAVLASPFKSVSWPGLWMGDVSYASNGGKAVTVSNIRIYPTVTLSATVASAYDNPTAPTAGVFTVTRGTWTNGTTAVGYTISGSATPGPSGLYTNLPPANYAAYTGAVTIADGQSNATVTICPVRDPTYTGNKTVILTLTNSNDYAIGSPSNGTVTIVDYESGNVAPQVSIASGNQYLLTNALPAVANLTGTVTDDGQPSGVLTSLWSKVSGPGTVTFGNATNVNTTASFSAEGDYVVQLLAGDSALTSSTNCTVSAYLRTVSVQATDANCGLTATDTGTFQISRPNTATNEALTVNYTLSGATSFVSASPASGFTLAAGQASTNVTLTPLLANFAAATNVVLSLVPGVYALGTPAAATCAVVQVTATALTLTTNAYLNGSAQLIRDGDQAVLLTATSGTGATNSPYVFDLGGHLNMAGFTIRGATNNVDKNQYSATWQVWGNVTSNGNFDSYSANNGFWGGHVRIDAGGGIAVGRVLTRTPFGARSGDVYLWAKGGSVAVTNVVDTYNASYGNNAGHVTIRSEGPVAGQAIAIGGTADGTNSIRAYAVYGMGGDTRLYCEGPVTLAGGIRTSGAGDNSINGQAGVVTIRGSQDTPSLRAGVVSLGADINSASYWRYMGGDVSVLAASCAIGGSVLTCSTNNAGYGKGGGVAIDATNDCTIAGYINTRTDGGNNVGPCGRVTLSGQHIRVAGTDAAGVSIVAQPLSDYTGTMWSPVAGDGDVTLTGGDSYTLTYDPLNPTNGATSSIFLAGGIKTHRASNSSSVKGDIRLSAVEVQVGGGLSVTNADSGTVMALHYGVTTHGIVTHLVEQGVRWNGSAAHQVTYTNIGAGAAAPTFTADVPYAGALVVSVPGTIFNQTVTNVTQTSALFRGYLQSAGSPTSAVSVLWGSATNSLNTTNGWSAGTWADSTYPQTNVTTLTANTNVYYAFVAANAGGTNTASPAQYFITGPVTPAAADNTCGVSLSDTATIAISRPASCVAGPLTVNYVLSGAGTNDVSVSPASGFTLAAGQASTNVVFTALRPNFGVPLGVTLTLLPGAYPSDALGSDSITVATAVGSNLTAASDTSIGTALDVVENPPDTVACSVAGATNTYDFWTSSLNLNGKRMYYQPVANPPRSLVLANLTALTDSGAGWLDTSTSANYVNGGGVTVQAAGGIALHGTNVSGYAIDAGSTANPSAGGSGGDVTLIATGGVALTAGGIRTSGGSAGGNIAITDGAGGTAGNVTIGGAVEASSAVSTVGGGGSLLVRGATVTVAGNVVGRSMGAYFNSKSITLIASGTLAVGGYLATEQSYLPLYSGSGGAVTLTGATVTVSGTTNGMSIATWCATNYGSNAAGDIRVTATSGDLTLAGGVDASHPTASSRGSVVLSAPNGMITVGSLDAARFKTISLQPAAGQSVYVTGTLTNFAVSESPKRFTFPANSAVNNDIYYLAVNNTTIPLTGAYDIYVAGAGTGYKLKAVALGSVFVFR